MHLSISLPPSISLTHTNYLSFNFSMSAAGRIGTADLVDRTYRFVKKVREDEEAAAPKIPISVSIDSDLYEEEDETYH